MVLTNRQYCVLRLLYGYNENANIKMNKIREKLNETNR